jgi:hypothetical protein
MEQLIVLLIVGAALLFVLKRFLPAAARLALRRLLARAARTLGWMRLAQRLDALPVTAGACGACEACRPRRAGPTDQTIRIDPGRRGGGCH